MKYVNKMLLLSLYSLLGVALSMPVSAGIIYNSFVHVGTEFVDYTVTIEHDSGDGQFDITYTVSAGSPGSTAKLTGFFFDFGSITLPLSGGDPDTSDPYTLANLGLSNQSNPSGTSVCGIAVGDVNSISGGGGCNSTLNYGTLIIDGFDYAGFLFDVGLAWKVNDLSNGGTGSFSISDLGTLTIADWGALGLRGQAVDGGGSAKEFQLISRVTVPEPTPLVLLGLGLVALFATRRHSLRKKLDK